METYYRPALNDFEFQIALRCFHFAALKNLLRLLVAKTVYLYLQNLPEFRTTKEIFRILAEGEPLPGNPPIRRSEVA